MQKHIYRPELDGLRAIAVLAVIIFHFDENLLKGGFLGVDVFFVLSGYLITLLIIGQIQNNNFSLWEFWKRRIARLYPAMAAMVVVVLLVGHFVLVQPERGDMPLQAVAALFSFQNILLWKTTGGYWDSASESIPLLHTWSLSVEEQFYIIFPITLLLFHKLTKSRMNLMILSLFLASLFLCILATPLRRSAAFYLLPARMWELLIGAVVAIYWRKDWISHFNNKSIVLFQTIGIIVIISSFFLIENDVSFPSYLPLFPSLGTAILLCFGASSGIIQAILSSAPVVYIGKISYSLYLWHWPVLVYSNSISIDPNYLYLSLSIFTLSIFSYHFIETPLRYRTQKSGQIFLVSSLCVFLSCIPIVLLKSSPLLKNLGNIDEKASLSRGYEYEATDSLLINKTGLYFKANANSPHICLVGSSHARVLAPALHSFCKEHNLSFSSLATSGVGIVLNNDEFDGGKIYNARSKYIEKYNPDIILVAGMWSSEIKNPKFHSEFFSAISEFSNWTKAVVVLSQIPMFEFPNPEKQIFRKYIVAYSLKNIGKPSFIPSQNVVEANSMVKNIIDESTKNNILFIDIYDLLLDKENKIMYEKNGIFLYSDHHHINNDGSQIILDNIKETLLEKLK
jgi:peptidoglycan/LPS O-acetylase OafA/YrhL